VAAEHTSPRSDYVVELRLQPWNEVISVERERETQVLLLAELEPAISSLSKNQLLCSLDS